MFDRVTDSLKCDKIISDNNKGAYKATKYLIDLGCKKIALITKFNDLSVVIDRENGYRNALNEVGLLDENLIININNVEESEQLIEKFLLKNKVDAVLSTNELFAIKTIKVSNKLGFNVPTKMKIIGFSNGELSKEFYPSLSAVDLQPIRIGNEAVKALLNRINKEIPFDNFIKTVRSNLVQRNSTAI